MARLDIVCTSRNISDSYYITKLLDVYVLLLAFNGDCKGKRIVFACFEGKPVVILHHETQSVNVYIHIIIAVT